MRETVCSEPECRAPLVPGGQAVAPLFVQRPFTNLCFVCALAIYIERLASFALKGPPRADSSAAMRAMVEEQREVARDGEVMRSMEWHDAMARWIRSHEELMRKVDEERRRMNQ